MEDRTGIDIDRDRYRPGEVGIGCKACRFPAVEANADGAAIIAFGVKAGEDTAVIAVGAGQQPGNTGGRLADAAEEVGGVTRGGRSFGGGRAGFEIDGVVYGIGNDGVGVLFGLILEELEPKKIKGRRRRSQRSQNSRCAKERCYKTKPQSTAPSCRRRHALIRPAGWEFWRPRTNIPLTVLQSARPSLDSYSSKQAQQEPDQAGNT
jgi:hypothetical protein